MKEKHGKRGAILMQSVDCDCCINKKTKKKSQTEFKETERAAKTETRV